MWAAEQQPTYAPELAVKAIAAGGVPSNLEAAARNVEGGPGSGLVVAASFGLAREYPEMELDRLLNDHGRAVKEESREMCLEDLVANYPLVSLDDLTTAPNALDDPKVQAVLAATRLPKAIPTAPIYLYHGLHDELIPYETAVALAQRYCLEGAHLTFVTDPTAEHIAVSEAQTPEVLAFLYAQLNGQGSAIPTNCAATMALAPVSGPAPYDAAGPTAVVPEVGAPAAAVVVALAVGGLGLVRRRRR